MEPESQIDLSDCLTPAMLSAKYPAFPPNCLRRLLFYRETNGMHEAVMKIGSKIFISERRFLRWIQSHDHRGNSSLIPPAPPAQRKSR